MRCTSRQPVQHMYEQCKQCPDNISGYGVCKRGFENFYARRTKKVACPRIIGQNADREGDKFEITI